MKKATTPLANQMDFAGRAIEKDGIRRDGLHQFFSCAKPPLISPARRKPHANHDAYHKIIELVGQNPPFHRGKGWW
jgi:hypothetical protein